MPRVAVQHLVYGDRLPGRVLISYVEPRDGQRDTHTFVAVQNTPSSRWTPPPQWVNVDAYARLYWTVPNDTLVDVEHLGVRLDVDA